jgi:UDP-4-amino-4-deoxy-L-arabinose-oxoglutarate aminotransferase
LPYHRERNHQGLGMMSLLFALDLPRGSEIMAPSYTAWATTAPMHLFGYVPVFIDISPRTQTFDLEYAEKHLIPLTRAVMPVHSFGNPCDLRSSKRNQKDVGLNK